MFYIDLNLFSIVLFVILGLIALVVMSIIKTVPQGWEYTIERFGRYTHTIKPGLHFLMPFADRIGAKIRMMETVLDVPSQDVITKDNAAVVVDGIVFFQVLSAAKAAYEVANLDGAIQNLTMTNIRTVMGSMDLDELLSNREVINAKLLLVVDEATSPWGIKVTRIEIKDIRPPENLVMAMGRQMKAEREKRASILEAEGEKQSAVLRAEGVKLGMILEAEGRKESALRDAEARERLAQAEAHATQGLSDAISQGSPQAMNYFIAQKYIEAFHALASSSNQKIILMPMESSSLVSSLAGITEIVKDAFVNPSVHTPTSKR